MKLCQCCWWCCSGLEEVLGVQLPKDLSSDEAQKTLAKLVSQLTALSLFDCCQDSCWF